LDRTGAAGARLCAARDREQAGVTTMILPGRQRASAGGNRVLPT
jgi:hypothetical protein